MLEVYEWIVIVLASFRLTRLLIHDEITSWLRKPFLEIKEEISDGQAVFYLEPSGTGIRKWIGMLLSCYWCMGVWTTSFLYISWMLLPGVSIYIAHILALAGTAAILEAFFRKYID
ncbi:DUF1360 domain-containing protein [Alkalicoccobacillus plakortidis]|uniref:DUF1360 domain-containing protein n=1 Tax=Alkalicoccobacillus plakortidis TaxID=444060 RepID=A0ABT0XI69_9BACI|nr:DUF1360 domain-containing protein [Alkalicoccobacillus plakortidis]MCM2675043.1 DUF1360 domain-containing protein [Alkalicoccobacillus plakortidis]